MVDWGRGSNKSASTNHDIEEISVALPHCRAACEWVIGINSNCEIGHASQPGRDAFSPFPQTVRFP